MIVNKLIVNRRVWISGVNCQDLRLSAKYTRNAVKLLIETLTLH